MALGACLSNRTRRTPGPGPHDDDPVFFLLSPLHDGGGAMSSNAGALRMASHDFGPPVRAFFWGGAMFYASFPEVKSTYLCAWVIM